MKAWCAGCGEPTTCKRYAVTSGGVTERRARVWCEACHLEAVLDGPATGLDLVVELCSLPYRGDCIRQAYHDGFCLFRCAGPACPGLTWPASERAHPYSCVGVLDPLDHRIDEDAPEFPNPGKGFSRG